MVKGIGLPMLGGVAFSLAALLALMVYVGLDERSTPIAVSVTGAIVTTVTALAAFGKAGEAAHSARGARRATELTASQTAAMQQTLIAHCGDICPSPTCPLRIREGVT